MASRGWRPTPLAAAALACVLIAIASLALPSGVTYDPYSWLVWGREIAHGHLALLGTGTSWKPLPPLIDALLSPLGSRAAHGWLVVARAGALFAACVAFALAWRLAPAYRWLAGVCAAASVLLTSHWINRNGVGGAEGLMVALGLLAILRHLDRHRMQAFWLVVAACLIRVEMWPFAFVYGWWLWWHDRRRLAVAIGLPLIPVMWFGGDWLGSGDPMRGAKLADRAVHGSLATAPHPALAVLQEAAGMLPPPAWVAVAAALVWAIVRREAVLLWIAGAAIGWTAIVVVMTERGYPGEDRFLFMATGLESVLAGVGSAVAALALAQIVMPGRRARMRPVAAVAAATVAAAFAAGSVAHAGGLPADLSAMDKVAASDAKLVRTVQNAGGPAAVLRCGPPLTNWYTVPALAYDLNVPALAINGHATSVQLPCRANAGLPPPGRS